LYLFRSDEDLVDWYADRRRRERDAGRLQPCAAGLPLSWEWPGTDGTPGGRLLCFVTPGNYAHIRWIRYDVPIGGGASGPTPDGDIGYVYGWWRDQLNAPYISAEVP
nr:hypothetical protein [Chloroflexota bacterium]